MDLLGTLLLAILVVCLLATLTVVLALLFGLRALRRRNRVSPDVASPTPLRWVAGHPSATARLHRRLRSAVAAARAASDSTPSAGRLRELTSELEREAVTLDHHLAAVGHLAGPDRRARLAVLGRQVRQVERVASQVSLLSAQAQAPTVAAGQASALDDLAHQLDLLEQARTEVADVEAAAGLHRPSPYASEATSRRPRPPGTPSPGG